MVTVLVGKQGMKVVGCVLSCEDSKLWKQKLERYDQIEGYNEKRQKKDNFYQRDKVTAKILDSGEEVEVFMYNRPDGDTSIVVPNGDWL